MDIKPLAAAEGAVYRLRVGDYRVLYEVDMGSGRVYVTGVSIEVEDIATEKRDPYSDDVGAGAVH